MHIAFTFERHLFEAVAFVPKSLQGDIFMHKIIQEMGTLLSVWDGNKIATFEISFLDFVSLCTCVPLLSEPSTIFLFVETLQ